MGSSEEVGDEAGRNAFRYERTTDERPSTAVVTAVSAVAGKPVAPAADTTDGEWDQADVLLPLYEAVDPDALDALVASGDGRDADLTVTFTYCDYTVTVADRFVRVRD